MELPSFDLGTSRKFMQVCVQVCEARALPIELQPHIKRRMPLIYNENATSAVAPKK